jgi:hypothetical protein
MGLTVVPGNMIEDGTVTDSNFTNTTITSTDMALDPRNASNISSGQVPLAQLGNVDLTSLDDDAALLGFKTAANGSLAKYNLLDQTVDAFEDTSGVDAGSSTDETRNAAKYYSGAVAGVATYTVFTTTPGGGTWTVPAGVTSVEALVVAGGGTGGLGYGGGGGAGGIVHHTSFAVTPGADVTVTVGAGGAAASTTGTMPRGGDSVFSTMTATGGGGGSSASDATSGGSGGGGSMDTTPGGAANQPAVSGATVYANAGGTGESAPDYTGGGGGGAAAAGSNSNGNAAGPGGAGKQFSNFTSYGESSGYFGGGGGGTYNVAYASSAGTGGIGGGGNGRELSAGNGYPATANTGSGGGAGGRNWSSPTTSGAGGSGFVGLLYTPNVVNNMTLVSTATAAQAAPTKGDIVFTYTNGAGTAVINTNITAEVSADGGSTWTAFTLASQGTTGGHTILTSHDQTITSTITAPWNMKYRIKTLVQSASMDTRIQAVSLGWS